MKKIIFVILLLIFLISCTQTGKVIFSKNKVVTVEIAKDQKKQETGLMFQESLSDDKGMLFIWETEANRNFWMKDTKIPLDIIFLNKDYKITGILQANPCEKEPCNIYAGKAQYVVEVNQGFTKNNNIKVGQTVKLEF